MKIDRLVRSMTLLAAILALAGAVWAAWINYERAELNRLYRQQIERQWSQWIEIREQQNRHWNEVTEMQIEHWKAITNLLLNHDRPSQ